MRQHCSGRCPHISFTRSRRNGNFRFPAPEQAQLIDPKLDNRFPDVRHLKEGARRRIPKFVFEYVSEGTGIYDGIKRNRDALKEVLFTPQYTCANGNPEFSTTFLGETFDAPFGVAPLGLGGLIWPRSAHSLAKAARSHNVPFILSNFATASMESIAEQANDRAWFQLYPPNIPEIENSHLSRLKNAGYETLVVTVDTPTAVRRPHDVRNGLSVPPRIDYRTVCQMISRPRWALEQLRFWPLKFDNMERYVPAGSSFTRRGQFLSDIMEGRVHRDRIAYLRDNWQGKLIVKGIMHQADATACVEIGADAIVVSNHGARQLDSAPATAQVLPKIKEAVGQAIPIIADGGIRSGEDIARMLALGADFVLLGRAFAYAVAAAGERGAYHVIGLLMAELRIVMGQMGCLSLHELPEFVSKTSD